jgi:hypothetical protein
MPIAFAVYALSRGQGVPKEARRALELVRELVEADRERGIAVRIATSRIGIEGETRLCAEYADLTQGARAFERARSLVRGVDLVNLETEPCELDDPIQEEGEP